MQHGSGNGSLVHYATRKTKNSSSAFATGGMETKQNNGESSGPIIWPASFKSKKNPYQGNTVY